MITIELSAVNSGIGKNEGGGMILAFADEKSDIRVVVPFDEPSWERFKRHVAADGALPAIVLAPFVPEKNGEGGI